MKHLRILTSISTGLSALILAILPILVAIDFGGVLWWTQYVAGLAIVVAFVLALPTLADWQRYFRPRQLLVIIPMLMWLMYSYFQTIPLSPSLIGVLSPGSYTAYTEWLEPILPAAMLPKSFPISIAQDDTTHAVALFGVLFVLAWTSLRVFNTRGRLIALLSCVAITGATISILGIVGLMLPEIPFFRGMDRHFSTFVNRNNAALALNLGLGASLGLLSWRLSALTGQELDGEEFEFNDLYSLTSDRDSAIGVFSALLCIIGLLVCGSRAGLATILFAMLLSLGWIRKRKGFSTIPVVLLATTMLAALLTVPLKLDLESVKRMQFFSNQSKTILNDGRFEHWPEGWQSALEYFPSGSGLSTYGNAYLPYQSSTPNAWFVHADNLWLELLVEQGAFGVCFALLLLAVLVWCLHRMSRSHDALDHGLRVTGWYSIGAILFSQCFDFGLVIPANLLLAIPIIATVVTRSVDSDLIAPDDSENKQSRWLTWKSSHSFTMVQLTLQILGLMGAIIAATTSVAVLQRDAVADTLARKTEVKLASLDPDDPIEDLRAALSAANQKNPHTLLFQSLAKTEHRLGQLAEVVATNPEDAAEAKATYVATSLKFRRLAGNSPSSFVNKFPSELAKLELTELPDQYSRALSNFNSFLAKTPLSREAREGKLYLDFAESDSQSPAKEDTTGSLLGQLGMLYRSSPRQLMAIANLAAQSRDNTIATSLWKSAIDQNPGFTAQAVNTIRNYKLINLVDALPENSETIRRAVRRVVQLRDKSYAEAVPKMVTQLACEECGKTDDKAKCLLLAAQALVFAGQHEQSIDYFEQALQVRPSSVFTRLQYISALRKLGRNRDALTQARQGRQISPDDKRFGTVIKQMADEQIQDQ